MQSGCFPKQMKLHCLKQRFSHLPPTLGPPKKRKVIFQPSIFICVLFVSEMVHDQLINLSQQKNWQSLKQRVYQANTHPLTPFIFPSKTVTEKNITPEVVTSFS